MPLGKPSKKFVRNALIITSIGGVIILFQTNWFHTIIQSKKEKLLAENSNLTIRQLVEKDSNGNGIPDWEEQMWGLDPAVAITNGVSNKSLVEQKRKEFQAGNNVTVAPSSKTDKIAQSLYALTTALGQDNADIETLKTMAEQAGAEVNTDGFMNQYHPATIKIIPTSQKSLQTYYTAFSKRYDAYPNIGDDLNMVATASDTGTIDNPDALAAIATSYKSLAKDLAKTSVPVGAALYHLQIINSLDHIGDSIQLILLMNKDGIQGVIGTGFYEKYSLELSQSSSNLKDYLASYSILSE